MPPAPLPPATPLPGIVQRFLKPLVGIDPATVSVHRTPEGDRFASRAGADALTVGESVILPTTVSLEAPEGLGLLAHEMTHVARNRQRRFVPPAARPEGHGRQEKRPGRGSEVLSAPEEQVAADVETQAARLARDLPPTSPIGASPGPRLPDSAPPAPSPAPRVPSLEIPSPTNPSVRPPGAWGGLPAPWEPLPTWLEPPISSPAPVTPPPPVPAPTAAPPPVAASQRSDGPGIEVQRAATDRPGATAENQRPREATTHHTVEPDLDALARQVYDVLKRRIAAERRRAG